MEGGAQSLGGPLDLREVFKKPGRMWTAAEREACARWLLEEKGAELLGLVRRRLGGRRAGEAEEVLSSFWPGFWSSVVRHYDPGRGRELWSYLHFCLLRHCDQEARRLPARERRARREVELQLRDPAAESDLPRALENRDLVQRALDRLRPGDATLIAQIYIEGRERAELSLELGLSRQALNTRLCRALQAMKREVDALRRPR
jgi:RNA polymerase sigma factor (sigma-70 family)